MRMLAGDFLIAAFPTCVGMNRVMTINTRNRYGVPHVRGDEPLGLTQKPPEKTRSPRAWG